MIAALNIIILAIILAVLALGLSTKSASAHRIGASSVDTSKSPDEIRMGSMSISYTDSRNYGISQWRLRKPVVIRWVASGETPTVVWAQNDDTRSDTSVGAWSNQSGFDVIFYFSENINQFGWTNDTEDLRWIGTHELGHGLNLNHSNPDYNAYGSVMISHRTGGSNEPHYPVYHDDNDYDLYW